MSDDEVEPFDPAIARAAHARRKAEHAQKRTLVKGKRVRGRGGKPAGMTKTASEERALFIGRLLDRGATRQQVIDALRRPKSSDPAKPGGYGLTHGAAQNAFKSAIDKRVAQFKEEARTAREEQALRLRGHISGAVADKQFGPVAALERQYSRVLGTDAALRPGPPRGEFRDLIADMLGDMTEDEVAALAAEDVEGGEEEEEA